MKSKVILVCKDGESKEAYLRELESVEAEVDVVASFGELLTAMTEKAYQGVLIDLATSIKASREGKEPLQDALEVFPIIQIRWDSDSSSIRTISSGRASAVGSLAEFITVECKPFAPRMIRSHPRRPLNFNVLLYRKESMEGDSLERTVTINASRWGCFLFSAEDRMKGGKVWLTINELEDKTPIVGVIRWSVKWGLTMVMPGIGVGFESITPGQKDELVKGYDL
ncbi:MAG: PilZ domain-containing protein [Syntrophorhabdales bacterium]|jgi:hypothetical protein